MAHLESNRRAGSAGLAHRFLTRQALPNLPRRATWQPLALACILIMAWEVGVARGNIPALYFPAPSFILQTTARMLGDGVLLPHLGASLMRMALALLLGAGPGMLLGLLMGWSGRMRAVVEPFIAAVHPLPKIALLPLVMVIAGINDVSLVIVSAMGAFFPMLINVMIGVSQINPGYFEVARNYGASPVKVFARVVWPGCRAWMLTGLRLALNTTLLLSVSAEMISASKGLGAMILMAWNTYRTEEIYVSLLLITLLGMGCSLLVQVINKYWMPWEKDRIQ